MSDQVRQALAASIVVIAAVAVSGCERPPVETTQVGFRGTGMVTVTNPRLAADIASGTVVPEPLPRVPAGGPTAGEVYQNVQVLGDLSVAEFARVMNAITAWVAPPDQSCAYCHVGDNFATEGVYTKDVARRMLQMNANINADWTDHVKQTGVTCYTCHRGQPVPEYVWYANPGPDAARGMAGYRAGQNIAAPGVGLTSLPYDPFTPFLKQAESIRVVSSTALPTDNPATIKGTEVTYGLMMHMSDALGVNCTFCHNTRSFAEWGQSAPQRVSAWQGIQMARQLNQEYLVPLTDRFPANRLGPLGDVAKINCATCHQGLNKPLFGAAMAQDYPELGAAR
ncbi:MAG TPA: photosynthetic reaction center cytochrome PufC [Steroidobacteraceae bacterium]|nr:photosynthetic reaction center cytochrome PufC [Steroidobacteraceae bacterium]